MFAVEINFMSHLKRFDNEKENPFFRYVRVCRSEYICAGPGPCRYQRSHQYDDQLF